MTRARDEQARDKFLLDNNPSRQLDMTADPLDAIMGAHPTLTDIDNVHGGGTGAAWLVPQVADLSEFCGCKDKISKEQLRELARMIRHDYHWLKTSELMLFFRWMKSGRYGHFYGSVDPQRILCSLRAFIADRNDIIDKYERQRREQEAERERRETAELWERLGGYANYLAARREGLSHEKALEQINPNKTKE